MPEPRPAREQQPAPHPPRRGATLRLVLGVVVAGVLLGALAGVVWEWWWTPPDGVALDDEFVFTPAGLREGFSGTGLYVLVAAAAGLVLGVGAALRADGRELPVLLALTVASGLAAAVMGLVGRALGPPDADARAVGLDDLTPLVSDLRVEGAAPWLALPTAALLAAAAVFLALTRRDVPAGTHAAKRPHPAGRDR